ncbi:beta strand repeat-containing protein [Sphingomonas sp. NCPPB 2930]
MPFALKKTLPAMAILAGSTLAPLAQAQESVLNGLGWVTARPGSSVEASSVQSVGNRAPADVNASGAKASAALGIAGSVELISTAQANTAGISALTVTGSRILVLQNQAGGFVRAVGGAATANTVLLSGGAARRPFADSHITVTGNRADNVEAIGGKGTVLLGAGSLQLPGRATANGVLMDETDTRRTQVDNLSNQARGIASVGGAALANALTANRSTLEDLRITQSGNRASDLQAGGGSASAGWGWAARSELAGVSAGNAVAVAGSRVQGARIDQTGNTAEGSLAVGGSALANSVNLADYQGSALRQYRVVQSGNTARKVDAWGGTASVLKGALASSDNTAMALANTVSVRAGDLAGSTEQLLTGNTADTVQAAGGGAAANSIWLDDARTRNSRVTLAGNTARGVDTAGGQASIGGGVVGEFERRGRAVANSLVLDQQTALTDTPVVLTGNDSRGVRGHGGVAAAASVLATQGRIERGAVKLSGNRADGVSAEGYSGSVGAGLLFDSQQNAMALANSIGVFNSRSDARQLLVTGNTARQLSSQGGKVNANSISVESGEDGAPSSLSASVLMSGNTAVGISSGAGSTSGPGHVFSSESAARAAANAVVLNRGATADQASAMNLVGNRAEQVGATGGTALVNTLAAYRQARIVASPATVVGNRATDVQVGGNAQQVAGVGNARNGILAANALYMEGPEGVRLSNTPLTLSGNTASSLRADGGRINANALAINGAGSVDAATVTMAGNTARNVRSQGTETTVFGRAIEKNVGNAGANAVQLLGSLRAGSLQLLANTADRVSAEKGLALANSLATDEGSTTQGLQLMVAGNTARDVIARDGKTALANSVLNEGRIGGSALQMTGNTGSATTGSADALANSLRNGGGADFAGSNATVAGNQGAALQGGAVNSVDNAGRIGGAQITVAGNRGSASGKGRANGVDNGGSLNGSTVTVSGNNGTASGQGAANMVANSGTVTGSNITILGNQGSAQGGGAVNSLVNTGRVAGSQITILGNQGNASGGTLNGVRNAGTIAGSQIVVMGNQGSASGGGTVNSVHNRGSGAITGSQIAITGNRGTAMGGGTVNSVDNRGVLTGRVVIAGNQGMATGGGTVNSLVNQGVMTGVVAITGNRGAAMPGGTSNSVINHGVLTGAVAIVGNATAAGPAMTSGSVRNMGALVGGAAVTGNIPSVANPGYTVPLPSTGVVNQSVTIVPGFNITNM